ncbi:MAG TPA: ATP-binding protein [Candidatus Merdenecus merdavium]|nr:ATP-binding protein [Candidatus Merdenecus merdavium]
MALRNSQYDSIIREYDQKQFHHRHELDRRIQELYGKYKEFQEIDEEISSLSVACGRKLIEGDLEANKNLKHDIANLTKKRTNLLLQLGYPEDYLELHYDCNDCKDTGYIDHKKCHCFKKATLDLLYTQSNIKSILETENFSTFSYDYFNDKKVDPTTGLTPLANIKQIVSEVLQYIDHFDDMDPIQNFFFYGLPGVGKTFLTNCIAKELLDRNHSVIYFTSFQLFELLAKNTFNKNELPINPEQHVFDCDLLIIDDLGTELTNSFVSSQLFLCINERLLRKKSTIISTNLSLDGFYETYSERTFSRVSSNYTMRKFIGDDIRIQKKLMTSSP